MTRLRLENFCCGYRHGFTLKPLNLAWEHGTIAGIIGKNGSGKSTLFKGISGDLPPLCGRVLLGEEDLSRLSFREKARRLAVVQQFPPVSNIPAEEYVLLGRLPYRPPLSFSFSPDDKDLAAHYMSLTRVDHLRGKLLCEVSGGELQMLSLARALTQEPAVLLLDEPTSHLDICYQSLLIRILREIRQEICLTILLILHDLNQASQWCETLTLMRRGEVPAHGSPDEVLTPSILFDAYDTHVEIHPNPHTGRPVLTPL